MMNDECRDATRGFALHSAFSIHNSALKEKLNE